MGFGDDIKDLENDATGQGGQDGDNNANKAGGGNDKTEDTMIDSGIDYVAQKEGMSAALDPEVNNLANEEINKF